MRPRFSIAGLLALVAASGVAFAALRHADDLVASLTFSAAILASGVAALGAAFGRGRKRAFCTGFAAFGFGYMALCFGPFATDEVQPHLATTKLLDYLGPRVQRPSEGGQYVLGFIGVSGTERITTSRVEGSWFSSILTPPPPTLVVSATPEFMRVGHSLISLLLAALGGLVARAFAARTEREVAG